MDDAMDLRSAFHKVGLSIGIPEHEIPVLFNLLPETFRNIPAFHDRLTQIWRYDFGEPIERLPNNTVVVGPHTFPPVERLCSVLHAAYHRLAGNELNLYLSRLVVPAKHQDASAEFSPIIRVDASVNARFEVAGEGEGKKTIDWLLAPQGGTPVLFDVKSRIRDLVEGLGEIAAGRLGPDGRGPEPKHDVGLLFRDTESKFRPRAHTEVLQGIWIISHLRQERIELDRAFDSLDHSKIHFVILANWERDAYLLVRPGIQKDYLLSLFKVDYAERFVFDRGKKVAE